jgi:hypothetical protein
MSRRRDIARKQARGLEWLITVCGSRVDSLRSVSCLPGCGVASRLGATQRVVEGADLCQKASSAASCSRQLLEGISWWKATVALWIGRSIRQLPPSASPLLARHPYRPLVTSRLDGHHVAF